MKNRKKKKKMLMVGLCGLRSAMLLVGHRFGGGELKIGWNELVDLLFHSTCFAFSSYFHTCLQYSQ